jgi:hypothetical protein
VVWLPSEPPWRLGLVLLLLLMLLMTAKGQEQQPASVISPVIDRPAAPQVIEGKRRLHSSCFINIHCVGEWVEGDRRGRWKCDGHFEAKRVCPMSVEELKEGK